MKRIVFLYLILILILAGVVLARSDFFNRFKSNNNNPSGPQAVVNNKKINLLLANTEEKQVLGLSTRKDLPENDGMLFIFKQKDYYPFWMKNMKFPIDIIFINDDKIVDIYENVQPPEEGTDLSKIRIYKPKEKANYVLEVNAGYTKNNNFKIGDKIDIKNINENSSN